MNAKHLYLGIAALLAAGGLWLARPAWHTPTPSSLNATTEIPPVPLQPGTKPHSPGRLAPPDPSRRFTDFTPEQRVEFARKGHGPGG